MEKYKVVSNKEELDDIGISEEINGLTGILVKSYPTGWLVLSIETKIGEYEFTNEYDFPKYMLKKV